MKPIIILLFFVCVNSHAQNTFSFPENGNSPKSDLTEIAWMEGHWKGEAFGGITQEIWSPP